VPNKHGLSVLVLPDFVIGALAMGLLNEKCVSVIGPSGSAQRAN
jgi:hypothetical protein